MKPERLQGYEAGGLLQTLNFETEPHGRVPKPCVCRIPLLGVCAEGCAPRGVGLGVSSFCRLHRESAGRPADGPRLGMRRVCAANASGRTPTCPPLGGGAPRRRQAGGVCARVCAAYIYIYICVAKASGDLKIRGCAPGYALHIYMYTNYLRPRCPRNL